MEHEEDRHQVGRQPDRGDRPMQAAATLERLLFALGIEHVGESTAKALAQWFGDWS
jgi:hypothetical protein